MRSLLTPLGVSILFIGHLAIAAPPQPGFGVFFRVDPLTDGRTVLRGAAFDRLHHVLDPPAWPGDRPGSLSADYTSDLPAAMCGYRLPRSFGPEDAFAAGATFVIDREGYVADPNGFFQISWGVWNAATTGLDRTGGPSDFAVDTFELLEFDYFPNVSPWFGGPYLSPTAFGVAVPDDPTFPFAGAFANAAFAFGVEVDLPRGVPLLAVMEHRPDLDSAVISVHEIVGARELLPLAGAVTVIPLDAMPTREYRLDTLGLTLWHDGFGGDDPALRARVVFHSLVLVAGKIESASRLLRIPPTPRD